MTTANKMIEDAVEVPAHPDDIVRITKDVVPRALPLTRQRLLSLHPFPRGGEITDASVIKAFKSGVCDHYTIQELATRKIMTAMKLFEIVERYAWVDEAIRGNDCKGKAVEDKAPSRKHSQHLKATGAAQIMEEQQEA
ncbi:hypothetical protein E2562_029198 [Oryza meyeriana var. granulata]|uniref:Uncharacterized protein n=1 Tax=Oryza meyeriana var. granulata TaxID=110450 RepID=A0A6G1E3H6_9ORYZ|nr:hypothetical protein E2562_029198 [Oryza meyeriana var. granulata]